MEPKYTVTADDWEHVGGSVWIASIANPIDADRDELPARLGPVMNIDGQRYKIKSVESFALPHIRQGAPIRVLVEPDDTQRS